MAGREAEGDCESLTFPGAFSPDLPTVATDDLVTQGQAQTHPAKAPRGAPIYLVKALEQSRQVVRRNANPFISHGNVHILVRSPGPQIHPTARRAELSGVVEQVI